jgi:hypothetical protein
LNTCKKLLKFFSCEICGCVQPDSSEKSTSIIWSEYVCPNFSWSVIRGFGFCWEEDARVTSKSRCYINLRVVLIYRIEIIRAYIKWAEWRLGRLLGGCLSSGQGTRSSKKFTDYWLELFGSFCHLFQNYIIFISQESKTKLN